MDHIAKNREKSGYSGCLMTNNEILINGRAHPSLFGMKLFCWILCNFFLLSNVDRFSKETARREPSPWMFALFFRIAPESLPIDRLRHWASTQQAISYVFKIGSQNNTQFPKHRKTPWCPDESNSKPFTRLCRVVARTTAIRMTWCAVLSQRHRTDITLEEGTIAIPTRIAGTARESTLLLSRPKTRASNLGNKQSESDKTTLDTLDIFNNIDVI